MLNWNKFILIHKFESSFLSLFFECLYILDCPAPTDIQKFTLAKVIKRVSKTFPKEFWGVNHQWYWKKIYCFSVGVIWYFNPCSLKCSREKLTFLLRGLNCSSDMQSRTLATDATVPPPPPKSEPNKCLSKWLHRSILTPIASWAPTQHLLSFFKRD